MCMRCDQCTLMLELLVKLGLTDCSYRCLLILEYASRFSQPDEHAQHMQLVTTLTEIATRNACNCDDHYRAMWRSLPTSCVQTDVVVSFSLIKRRGRESLVTLDTFLVFVHRPSWNSRLPIRLQNSSRYHGMLILWYYSAI